MSTCQEENRCILDVCAADLSQRDKENLLLFFNHSWKKPMEGGNTIVHWCGPGCCSSESHCQDRFKEAIDIALGSFPDIPLLYSWKAFEPAANYVTTLCVVAFCIRFGLTFSVLLFEMPRLLSGSNVGMANPTGQDGPHPTFQNPGFRLNRCFNVDACKKCSEMYIYPPKTKDMTIKENPLSLIGDRYIFYRKSNYE